MVNLLLRFAFLGSVLFFFYSLYLQTRVETFLFLVRNQFSCFARFIWMLPLLVDNSRLMFLWFMAVGKEYVKPYISLIPRPSHHLVFDRLQYTNSRMHMMCLTQSRKYDKVWSWWSWWFWGHEWSYCSLPIPFMGHQQTKWVTCCWHASLLLSLYCRLSSLNHLLHLWTHSLAWRRHLSSKSSIILWAQAHQEGHMPDGT